MSYSDALKMTGLQTLYDRREERCLNFSLKSIKHTQNSRFFPLNHNLQYNDPKCGKPLWRENFVVNYARTVDYQNSAIPYCQRILNFHFKDKPLPKNIKSKIKLPDETSNS